MNRFRVRDQRNPGWSWFDNELIDIYARRPGADGKPLGVTGVGVYAALARFAGTRGRCQLSLTQLADRLAMSKPTVIKYLTKLEEGGLILKIAHFVEGSAEQGCNEYVLLDIKREHSAGGKDSLLPGQKILPPGQDGLRHGQQSLPPGQPTLPPAVNDVDQGSQAGSLLEDTKENTRKTQGYIPEPIIEGTEQYPTPAAAPADISSWYEEDEAASAPAQQAQRPVQAALRDPDGTVRYPYLAETCEWFAERFGKSLFSGTVAREKLRRAEEGLAQLAAAVAVRGDTLLPFLERRCWLNLKKQARLRAASPALDELTAQVAYALEDLARPAPGQGGAVSPQRRRWQAPGMSDEERTWREQAAREEREGREDG